MVLYEVWKKSRGAATPMGGFSGQPFSSLGDGMSPADPRSSCLSKLLYSAFYLRVHVLGLECVAPASQDSFVKAELEYFCHLLPDYRFFWCTSDHEIRPSLAQ